MRAMNEMVLREVAGEHILIPVGKTAMRVKGMISLSESGSLLWQKLQQDCTFEDLTNALLAEYDVDRAVAEQDVQAFLERLDSLGILVKDED
ncbi:MAG: PqqD family protein [Clostridia bacterium]|nr:PqqD family protein [Clostridia bacterium]